MNKASLLLIALLVVQFNSINAQRISFNGEDHITSFFNFEEWLVNHSGNAFRSLDINTLEFIDINSTMPLSNNTDLYINGNRLNTIWLSNNFVLIPNFTQSDIDSISINYLPVDFNSERQINIQTKKKTGFSFEASRINQVYDPGILRETEFRTSNVDAVHYLEKGSIRYSNQDFYVNLFINQERFTRTSTPVYDKRFGSNIASRNRYERNDERFSFLQNKQINSLLTSQYKLTHGAINFAAQYVNSDQYYFWDKLSGIEIPGSVQSRQFSIGYKSDKPGVFRETSFNFLSSISDTLNFTPRSYYGLNESVFRHKSTFSVPLASMKFDLSIATDIYSLTDQTSDNTYSFTEHIIGIGTSLKSAINLSTQISNTGYQFHIERRVNDRFFMGATHQSKDLFNTQFNYTYREAGFGYPNLDSNNHRINNASEFKTSHTKISTGFSNSSSNLFLTYQHYWTYVNEDVTYIYNGSYQLESILHYFDTENIGFLGFNVSHQLMPYPNLEFKTIITSSLNIYGDSITRDIFKSSPSYSLTEIIQYKPDENFALEILFKYIPARELIEYQNLDVRGSNPPSRIRPIPLLNLSSSMWFFDRRLEGKVTLRNLLNKTETYDTYGQYFNMSINISARINFDL